LVTMGTAECFRQSTKLRRIQHSHLQEYTSLKLFLGQQIITASEIHAGLLWTSDTTSLLIYLRRLRLSLLSTLSFRICQGQHRR